MTNETEPAERPSERWRVNMPAVIGVVFVALVAVVVWVLIDAAQDEAQPTATTVASRSSVGSTPATVRPTSATTSPAPMPSLATGPDTTEASIVPTTSTVTTAPDAIDGAVPGDLAVPGTPMQQPICNDAVITVLASSVGPDATAAGIGALLDAYPTSNYLRTDQTCPSLAPDIDGEPIYVVYYGPFAFESDACAARADGPSDAYARLLSMDVGPDHSVACP